MSSEQRAERRPRLDPRVPGLCGLVLVPRHIAQIIDRRQVRRRGKVRIGQAVAGEPVALANEPADIAQMISNVAARRPHRLGIGRSAAAAGRDESLVDALHDQRAAHLLEELVVEPAHQPAHLDARAGVARHQPRLRELCSARLVEVFGDDRRPGNRRHALFHQHRRRSRRIEDEKLLAPVPDPLLDEPRRQAELFKRRGARNGSADKTDDGTASACERRRVGTKSLRRVAGAGEPRRDSQMIPLIGEAKAQATGAAGRCARRLCRCQNARPCVTRLPLALLTRLTDDPAKCPVDRAHDRAFPPRSSHDV